MPNRRQKHSHQKDKKRAPQKEIEGILQIVKPLTGFLPHPSKSAKIEISKDDLHTALSGDTVRVRTSNKLPNGNIAGTVTKIVTRKKVVHVCEIEERDGVFYCEPTDPKTYISFIIPEKFIGKGQVKDKVTVKILKWNERDKNPLAEVQQVLGTSLAHETEMQAILLDKQLAIGFAPEIEKEAENVRSFLDDDTISKRRDMRGVPTFTIDPVDAKDFDDALSIQDDGKGNFEIGIHIADVSFFVRPGSLLDKEAARRGTSIYLVDRTIPMLPETLSNDLCSLNPDEDKLAYSAIFIVTKDGKVLSEWFGRTRIKSIKRFSYEEAQTILNKKSGEFYKDLHTLNTISKKLRKKRFAGGSIAFHDSEVFFVLDENMHPIEVRKKKQLETHTLIEDFMLLANKKVTEFIEKKARDAKIHAKFLYRVHDEPNPQKVLALSTLLKSTGHDIKIPKKITSETINEILQAVADTPEEDLIQLAVIQSMPKAEYTTDNIGHFGLAFPFYTHFTSPIRRYPDLLVHRLLNRCLNKKPVTEKEFAELGELAKRSSQKERVAQEAERESIKYKQAEFMQDHIGNTYTGIISGVVKFGLFVSEEKSRAEGLINIRSLKDDHYEYNEKKLALIGVRKKKKYQVGDKVKIKVNKVDLSRKQIDYILAR
tara:strand:+ start:34733 stop:36694 length:1962 start_codon:yes stop_codon:yes gene_type:complete